MRNFIICAVLTAISFHSFSQEKPGIIQRDRKGIISSVMFSVEENLMPRSAEDFFSRYLETGEHDRFEKVLHKSKKADFIHEHYDQYYKGVKVEGGGYNFHSKGSKMYFANGHYVKIDNIIPTPTVALSDAINSFLLYKAIEKEKVVSTITELLIKEIAKSSNDTVPTAKLVYRIYLQSDHINNNEVGFVDAHMGDVLATEPRTTDVTGTFATRYSGSQQAETTADPISGGYRLYDNTRGATIHTKNMLNNTTVVSSAVELTDVNNNWTATEHAASKNDMGLDVHWALQKIYDYLYNAHGINSFDDPVVGQGRAISAFVRYGQFDYQRENASWDPTQKVIYFGQGVSTYNPLASLDVVAHEFGHGITDFQIGWSGSDINKRSFHEGMSDIWGAILEQRIRPNATWRIAEQITKTKPHLRNLQNTNDPNSIKKIADTYGSAQFNNSQTTDEYVRSGVFSHWFYILVSGESGTNDIGSTYSVSGIGLDKAEKLIVEAVFNNYLDNTLFYPDVRTSMINAAKAIFCDNTAEVKAVTDAWYAVGVGAAYSGSVMTVTNSNLICSGGNVSLNNVPAGTAVSWQGTSYLFSPNTGSFSASGVSHPIPLTASSPTSGGSATVTVTLNNLPGCTVPAKIETTFWFGSPAASFSATYNSSHGTFTFTPQGNTAPATYSWVIDGVSYSGSNVIVNAPICGGSPYITYYIFNATLTATNSCGQSTTCRSFKFTCVPSKTFTSLGACGGGGGGDPELQAITGGATNTTLDVYPNPVSDELAVMNNYPDFVTGLNATRDREIEISLFNSNQERVFYGKSVERSNTIPVKKLPEGFYYLNVANKNGVLQRQIKIEH